LVLERIAADKRAELESAKRRLPLTELRKIASEQPPPLDFASALKGEPIKLIAEVKKASPSKGVIRSDFHPVDIARIYAENGASAISVLTESRYFQGSLDHLKDIRDALGYDGPPLLRKDFILDPYQVYESRACGADAVLLIVAILSPEVLEELLGLSHQLGMQCLVEVHNEAELEIALKSGARVIGINNRDLTDFSVDLDTTGRLRTLIPSDRIVVSESGIKGSNDMERLRRWGVDAALVGEALMAAPDIGAGVRGLLGSAVAGKRKEG
jgi:indole-3-glycerol phosphate synthase